MDIVATGIWLADRVYSRGIQFARDAVPLDVEEEKEMMDPLRRANIETISLENVLKQKSNLERISDRSELWTGRVEYESKKKKWAFVDIEILKGGFIKILGIEELPPSPSSQKNKKKRSSLNSFSLSESFGLLSCKESDLTEVCFADSQYECIQRLWGRTSENSPSKDWASSNDDDLDLLHEDSAEHIWIAETSRSASREDSMNAMSLTQLNLKRKFPLESEEGFVKITSEKESRCLLQIYHPEGSFQIKFYSVFTLHQVSRLLRKELSRAMPLDLWERKNSCFTELVSLKTRILAQSSLRDATLFRSLNSNGIYSDTYSNTRNLSRNGRVVLVDLGFFSNNWEKVFMVLESRCLVLYSMESGRVDDSSPIQVIKLRYAEIFVDCRSLRVGEYTFRVVSPAQFIRIKVKHVIELAGWLNRIHRELEGSSLCLSSRGLNSEDQFTEYLTWMQKEVPHLMDIVRLIIHSKCEESILVALSDFLKDKQHLYLLNFITEVEKYRHDASCNSRITQGRLICSRFLKIDSSESITQTLYTDAETINYSFVELGVINVFDKWMYSAARILNAIYFDDFSKTDEFRAFLLGFQQELESLNKNVKIDDNLSYTKSKQIDGKPESGCEPFLLFGFPLQQLDKMPITKLISSNFGYFQKTQDRELGNCIEFRFQSENSDFLIGKDKIADLVIRDESIDCLHARIKYRKKFRKCKPLKVSCKFLDVQ